MEMTTVVLSKNCEKKKLLPSDDIYGIYVWGFYETFHKLNEYGGTDGPSFSNTSWRLGK